MANTVKYYQDLITNAYVSGGAALGITIDPTTWSAVNLDRLVIYIVAYCAWVIDTLMDLFKADVNETISRLKPHSLRWYAEKAKAFQFGYNLVDDTDGYDNTNLDPAVVEASKIVSYAAVVEATRGLRIKVAKDVAGDLGPLTTGELDAFIFYMKEIKDAGVRLNITSTIADNLKSDLTIIYNPLVLDVTGARIDGTNATPIQSTIKEFLKNLPFNGVFSIQKFVDAVQAIDGVTDLRVNAISARYGALPFASVNITYIPDSGYLRIVTGDLTITFVSE